MSSPPTSSPSILSPQKLFPRESSNGKAMPPVSSPEEACTITTCVRVRPLYERSAPDAYAASSDHPRDQQLRESASHMCIYRTSPTTLVVDQRMISSSASKEKDISRDVTFSFDKVFWSIPPEQKTFLHPADVGAGSGKEYCSQQDVFEAIGQPAVDAAMQGINVCVFAFGQTGSGKSHTIFGTMPAVDGAGLAPRLATQLFHDLDRLKHRRNLTDAFLRTDSTDTAQSASSVSSQALGFSYTVAVGCLEIYNEKLTDLLAKSSSSTSHRLSTSGTLHQQHHHHRTSSNGINHSRVNSLHHLSIPPSPVLPSLPEEDVSFGDEDPHASPAVCMSRQSPVGTPDGGLFAAAHSMHPIGTTHSDDEVDDIFGGGAAQTFPSISNINAATSSHSGASSLRIRHDPTLGTYVEGLRAELVESEESLIALVQQALRHRVTASNHVHDQSSRSHAIMYITVTQEDKISGTRKVSTINLVDLAGSERGARNGAVGHQLVESKKINLSLTSLRRVIDLMIADPAKHRKNSGTPTPIGGGGGVSTTSAGTHLPVRDSKLTEVMAESLGGNSKTSMIATVSPQERNIMETLDSLRYCSKAKGIVNRIKPNEERIAVAIQAIQHELERLGRELQWREDRHRFQEMSHFVQKRTNVVAALRITARERRTLCHTMREQCAHVSAELASCQGVLQARRVHADALAVVHQQLIDVTNMNNEVSAQLDAEQQHVDSLRELFNEAARDVAILEVTPLPPNVRKYLDAKKKCWRIACIHAAQELVIQREWDAQAARNQALKKECKALEEHLGVMDGLLDGATPEWASYRHFQQLLRNTAIALGMAHEGYHGNALDLRRGIAALQRQTIQLREGELRDAANDVQMVSSRCSEALSFSAGLICTLENGLDDAEEALRRVSTELASLVSGCATMEGAIASRNASMRQDRIDAETLREHGAHLDRQYASVKASVLSLERDVSSDEAELCAIEVELRAVEQDIKTGDVTAQVFVQHIVDAEKAARTLCLPDAIPTIPDTPLARGVLSLDRSSAALLATTPRRIAGSLDRALIRSQSQDSRVYAMTSGTPKLRGTATSTYSRTPLAWRQSVTLTPTLKSTLRPSEVSPRPEAPVPHLYTEDF